MNQRRLGGGGRTFALLLVLVAPCNPDYLPDEAGDLLSDTELSSFEEAGVPIYRGANPPNIESVYLGDSLEVIYDDFGSIGFTILPTLLTFRNQEGDSLRFATDTVGYDASSASPASISGSGRCFTVFTTASGHVNDCEYLSPTVISGCLDAVIVNINGIEDFRWGIRTEWTDGPSCGDLVPEGNLRVIKEMDDYVAQEDVVE